MLQRKLGEGEEEKLTPSGAKVGVGVEKKWYEGVDDLHVNGLGVKIEQSGGLVLEKSRIQERRGGAGAPPRGVPSPESSVEVASSSWRGGAAAARSRATRARDSVASRSCCARAASWSASATRASAATRAAWATHA